MELEKLEKLAKLVLSELPTFSNPYLNTTFSVNPECGVRFRNLMVIASKVLPEHEELFNSSLQKVTCIPDAKSVTQHLLSIIILEKQSAELMKDLKIFDSADEKMRQANLSFKNEDYPSVFHSLNTALELVLKDKLNIPSTITGINTSNVIDVLVKFLVKSKTGHQLFLTEAKKHVLVIDNKIKHQGYIPSKVDSINGISAMDQLISILRKTSFDLSEEVRNKIYDGL